jgi:hypothetical protein
MKKKKSIINFDSYNYKVLKVICLFEKKTFTAKINEIVDIYLKSKS